MYTEGIMKIYTARNPPLRFAVICTMAENAGYTALSFQGAIYVRAESAPDFSGWVTTCFYLTDFQDVQT